MENIHDKYKHFDWYVNFILALIDNRSDIFFRLDNTLVNSFNWHRTRNGHSYWYGIDAQLEKDNYYLSSTDVRILRRDALDFYKPLYEKFRLTNPELFI